MTEPRYSAVEAARLKVRSQQGGLGENVIELREALDPTLKDLLKKIEEKVSKKDFNKLYKVVQTIGILKSSDLSLIEKDLERKLDKSDFQKGLDKVGSKLQSEIKDLASRIVKEQSTKDVDQQLTFMEKRVDQKINKAIDSSARYMTRELTEIRRLDTILGEKVDLLRSFSPTVFTDAAVVLGSVEKMIYLEPSETQTTKLPAAELMKDKQIFLMNISSYGVTINPKVVAETINDLTSWPLASKGDVACLHSDGLVWRVIYKIVN